MLYTHKTHTHTFGALVTSSKDLTKEYSNASDRSKAPVALVTKEGLTWMDPSQKERQKLTGS